MIAAVWKASSGSSGLGRSGASCPDGMAVPACWRRLKQWEESGVLLKLWRALLAQLNDQQKLRWDECFADGSFIPAKKGATK
jgi:hypothetical protein